MFVLIERFKTKGFRHYYEKKLCLFGIIPIFIINRELS